MKNLIAIILFLVGITAHAANPSMAQLNFASNSLVAQISAAQVWTNAGGQVSLVGSPSALIVNPSIDFFNTISLFDAEMAISTSNSSAKLQLKKDEIKLIPNAGGNGIDIYTYNPNATPTVNSVLAMSVDGGYSDGCLLDPGGDNGGVPFRFSTGYSNTVADASTVFSFGNSHAEIVHITGDGGIITAASGTATNGFASYSTLATNAVTPTGWTNAAGVNVSGYITATAVSFTINDRSGAVLYTSPTLTATLPVSLQNGWSLRAASGLVGTILPW